MNRPQVIRFAAFVTVLAVLLGYVVYHRAGPANPIAKPRTHHAQTGVATSVTSLENFFVNQRMRRDRLMSQEVATIKSLLREPGLDAKARNEAMATVMRDERELKLETAIESELAAAGFPLAYVTLTSRQADVIVGGATLTRDAVARIADAVVQKTGMPPENVIIQPKR